MEITGINNFFSHLAFPQTSKDDSGSTPAPVQDVVNLSIPGRVDEEAEELLDETLSMLAADNTAALSAHSGLSQSRVYALLGM